MAQTSDPPGSEPLILTGELGEYPLGLHLENHEDPNGKLTMDEVIPPDFEPQFAPSQPEESNIGGGVRISTRQED